MALLNNTINGYEFLSIIGEGAFGTVYKANKKGVSYAIKVFHEEYVLREFKIHGEDNNRLQREIEIMKSVSHENLVKYIDSFSYLDEARQKHFLVMEYIEGKSLKQILENKDKLEETNATQIFKQILDGLTHLHEANIIHRDLKPENILMQKGGIIKIVDFGISKVIDYTSLTSTGDQIGTWLYMSPEQITDSKHIDIRSDLYTAGVILYEILTGYHPYDFQSFLELIDKIKDQNKYPVRPNSRGVNISNGLENIILKLLSHNPYDRFNNSKEIFDNILEIGSSISQQEKYDYTPRFVLRLNNDKGLLNKYCTRNPEFRNVIFPAHLSFVRNYQGLLTNIQDSSNMEIIIDPSTEMLSYDGYKSMPSFKELPYTPENISSSKFESISPDFLNDFNKLKIYVSKSINFQNQLKANIFLSPFHYLSNSTTISTTSDQNALFDWVDLDCKIAKECIGYQKTKYPNKKLYIGIAFQENILRNDSVVKQILNKYTLLDCDGFIVYIDKINIKTSKTVLYKYIKFLQNLQKSANRPVIAGRVNNTIGLGLLCTGISGFTSGASERDTFYEDLLKKEEGYGGIPIKYYLPQLLGSIIIPNRKDSITKKVPPPIRYTAVTSKLGSCKCYFCNGKDETAIIKASNVKLHFLELIHDEIEHVKKIPKKERKDYFLSRIDTAIDYYESLKTVVGFKSSEFVYLYTWKEVFADL